MSLWDRARALCRRICVLMVAHAWETLRSVRSYWVLYMALVISSLSWIGWMHERADKLGRLAIMQEDLHDYRERSTLIKERILDAVRDNSATLQTLIDAQKVGPRHTACDTKQILADLRAQGVRLPAYPVEARCK